MPALEASQLVGGRFRLLREIGRGAAGAVWHVRNETTHHDFALKVLHADRAGDPLLLRRFVNEARAAGRLRHPNVVEVYDTGTLDDGTPYQVMQLLEGESLGARLRREGRLAVAEAVSIARDVARGLAAAHARGIVHRDVKPENVFLSAAEPWPVAKLVDFGVSKLEHTAGDPLATREGALLGSPAYMSPEQIASAAQVDGRADVWAVGVVLYRCLAGRVPFPQRDLRELAIAIASAPPPPLAATRPDAPPAVLAIVDRCLAKTADARFPTADALADALTDALATPLARVDHGAPRARRRSEARRSRRLALALAAAALTLLAVAGAASSHRLLPAYAAPAPRASPAADPPASSIAIEAPSARSAAAPRDALTASPPPAPITAPAATPRVRAPSPHARAPRPNHEGVVDPGF